MRRGDVLRLACPPRLKREGSWVSYSALKSQRLRETMQVTHFVDLTKQQREGGEHANLSWLSLPPCFSFGSKAKSGGDCSMDDLLLLSLFPQTSTLLFSPYPCLLHLCLTRGAKFTQWLRSLSGSVLQRCVPESEAKETSKSGLVLLHRIERMWKLRAPRQRCLACLGYPWL